MANQRATAISIKQLTGAVVRFYNKRGTAEQWIKEGKQAVKMTRLSCHSIPVKRGAALVERNCLQPWEPLAAAGAAAAD
jgi:hypothetical protein